MTLPIGIVDDTRFDAHRALGSHPECPERLVAAREGLAIVPSSSRLPVPVREIASNELIGAHDLDFVRDLDRKLQSSHGFVDADTYYCKATREAAWGAAGATADLSRTLIERRAQHGFALIRPPGHHARPAEAMGFCFLNNVAIAARAAIAGGASRVAIVDWDVHHGNGTQEIFYEDERVLFASLHQFPFYPGTGHPREIGRGSGRGSTLNVGFPAGTGPAAYGFAFRTLLLPVLEQFAPDLVLVSAGFDAHRRDPLAQIELDGATYGAMASALLTFGAPVGFVLEGGYDLDAIRESVEAVGNALLGQRTELSDERVTEAERNAVEATRQALGDCWRFPEI